MAAVHGSVLIPAVRCNALTSRRFPSRTSVVCMSLPSSSFPLTRILSFIPPCQAAGPLHSFAVDPIPATRISLKAKTSTSPITPSKMFFSCKSIVLAVAILFVGQAAAAPSAMPMPFRVCTAATSPLLGLMLIIAPQAAAASRHLRTPVQRQHVP